MNLIKFKNIHYYIYIQYYILYNIGCIMEEELMKIHITAELLDGLVLAILKQDDYYGYALTQKVKNVIDVSESTMYPVLRRLKKNGDLTTYDKPFQGRNRR